MPAYLRVVIGLVGMTLAVGCGRQSTPPPANLSKPATSKQPAVDALPVDENVEAGVAPTYSPAEVPSAESAPVPTPDADDVDAGEAQMPERIAILTPGGPLLVDVRLTIGGRPHTEVFDTLVKRVLDAGDADDDGRPTWKEFAANREYLNDQTPNAPAAGSRQMKTLIDRYDENRDGQIQPGEAASWLGRDAGRSATPFALRSTRSYVPTPRATSQVWHWLDADNNGRLSSDETRAAPQKLLSLDANDDRIIAPPEMASLRELLEAAGSQRISLGRQASHYAAIHLEPTFEVDRLHYLLSDLYAPRQDLGPTSFRELAGLFDKLDANGDEWLEQDELAALFLIDPHVKLTVSFDESTTAEAAMSAVAIQDHAPEIAVTAQPSTDRVVLSLGNTRLIISAHKLTSLPEAGQNAGAANAANHIRLMVHDQCDALFEELDTNADGRLGEREIAFCADRLADCDANGDGQLSNDELPYSMIVAFLLGERPAEQSFYVPPSVTTATSDIQPPPWFTHADLNGDGDVSRREFLGPAEQFNRLDADQDGYVSAAEAAALQAD